MLGPGRMRDRHSHGHNRCDQCEREDPRVYLHLGSTQELIGYCSRKKKLAGSCDQQSERAAGNRKQGRLDQNGVKHLAAAGPERRPYGEFLYSHNRAREHEISSIGARDEQNESDRAQ